MVEMGKILAQASEEPLINELQALAQQLLDVCENNFMMTRVTGGRGRNLVVGLLVSNDKGPEVMEKLNTVLNFVARGEIQ